MTENEIQTSCKQVKKNVVRILHAGQELCALMKKICKAVNAHRPMKKPEKSSGQSLTPNLFIHKTYLIEFHKPIHHKLRMKILQ